VHVCACAHDGGEKRYILIVNVLLPIVVNFAMCLPRINIGADVWGESSIMRCLLTLVIVYFAHRMGSV
jgi:hypothetical protein